MPTIVTTATGISTSSSTTTNSTTLVELFRRPKIKLDWKHITLLGLCLYLAGFWTGSVVCSALTISTSDPSLPSMKTTLSQSIRQYPANRRRHERTTHITTAASGPQRTLLQPQDLKLPTPILVMGLMKAGTTSIYAYFQCGLHPDTARLSHYDCSPMVTINHHLSERIGMACGKRMRRNLTKFGKSAFDAMENFTLYAELDAQEKNGGMTLPQWSYLDAIYDQFPNATWILNWREPTKWLNSINRWKDLRQRFVDNPFPPILPRGVGMDDADMIRFYESQAQRIRDFCRVHPSLSLVELPIDSPEAGSILEEAFGISKSCWGQRNVNDGEAVWTVN